MSLGVTGIFNNGLARPRLPFVSDKPAGMVQTANAATSTDSITLRFAAAKSKAAPSKVSDEELLEHLPKLVQYWISLAQQHVSKALKNPDYKGPIGLEHITLGLLKATSKALETIRTIEDDVGGGSPRLMRSYASFKSLIITPEMEDDDDFDDPDQNELWESISNIAQQASSHLVRLAKTQPVSTEASLTPELRQLLLAFTNYDKRLITDTPSLMLWLQSRGIKETQSEKKAKTQGEFPTGLEWFNTAISLARNEYSELAEMSLDRKRLENEDDDEGEIIGSAPIKGKTASKLPPAMQKRMEAADSILSSLGVNEAKFQETLADSPYGIEVLDWFERLLEIKQAPPGQRLMSDRDISALEKRFIKFCRIVPKDNGDPAHESVMHEYAYMDRMFSLPSRKQAPPAVSLRKVKQQLDADHFGLKKPKDRIMKYMATELKLQRMGLPSQGKIMLFYGPRGVGKSSLAHSIAKATGRPMHAVALGGMTDAEELRGKHSVYINSEPGEMAKALIQTGSGTPVVLLDEVDKIANNAVKSALLEVLDPVQNKAFRDQYLGRIDLSNVLFIATANRLDTIPSELRNRIEIVELYPYTRAEKLEIAKAHLIPKVTQKLGLKPSQFKLSDKVLKAIITDHAYEPGVRQLERVIQRLGETINYRLEQGLANPAITVESLTKLLDPVIKPYQVKEPRVGRVNCLTAGGDDSGYGNLTPVDASVRQVATPKQAKSSHIRVISATGLLGKMFKDSIPKAIGYLESESAKLSKKLGAEDFMQQGVDNLLRVDFGGEDDCGPVDGPSAGITVTTAVLSALTQKPVNSNVAMTGTLSVHGDVGAIGGLMDKCYGAIAAGADTVLAPRSNISKDGRYIIEGGRRIPFPPEVLEKLKIVPINHFEEAIPYLFKQPVEPSPQKQAALKGLRRTQQAI